MKFIKKNMDFIIPASISIVFGILLLWAFGNYLGNNRITEEITGIVTDKYYDYRTDFGPDYNLKIKINDIENEISVKVNEKIYNLSEKDDEVFLIHYVGSYRQGEYNVKSIRKEE